MTPSTVARGRRVGVALLLAVSTGLSSAGCTERKAGDSGVEGSDTPDTELRPSEDLDDYWKTDASDVAILVERGEDLPAEFRAGSSDKCAGLAADLSTVMSPAELGEIAGRAPNTVVAESLLEYEAALSSAFAACRGDAPVSLEDALGELEISVEALQAVLREAGLR